MSIEISGNYGNYYNNAMHNLSENEQSEKVKTEKVKSS